MSASLNGGSAQIPVRRRRGELVKLTLSCPLRSAHEQAVSARKRSSAEGEGCVHQVDVVEESDGDLMVDG